MPLNGYDIANVNGPGIISRALTGDFVICKASEGLTFNDGMDDGWVAATRQSGKLVGHYHYAHLANDPIAEADFFLACAKPQQGDLLALDFEPYGFQSGFPAASYSPYITAFTDHVNAVTGARCAVYLNDDMASRVIGAASAADAAVIRQAPLWKARYNTDAGQLFGWPTFMAWQSGDRGIDADIFYGDANLWRALGVGGNLHTTPTPVTTPVTTPQEFEVIPRISRNVGNNVSDAADDSLFLNTANGVFPLTSTVEFNAAKRWIQTLTAPPEVTQSINDVEFRAIQAILKR